VSPAANLAAQLRDLAARAAAHSNPVALAAVLHDGFGAIAGLLEDGEKALAGIVNDAATAIHALTPADRSALEQLMGVSLPAGDQVQQPAASSFGSAAAPEHQPDAHLVDTSAVSEQELAAVATAPRVTLAEVQANIASEHYFTGEQAVHAAYLTAGGAVPSVPQLGVLTFCVLTLRNGFTVTGESACASPENFDPIIGQHLARENAVRKIWPLMGYELRSKLAGA
jgi:hypothetical protein